MLQQIITEYNRKGEFVSEENGTDANYKSARYEGTVTFIYHLAELVITVHMLSRCSTIIPKYPGVNQWDGVILSPKLDPQIVAFLVPDEGLWLCPPKFKEEIFLLWCHKN